MSACRSSSAESSLIHLHLYYLFSTVSETAKCILHFLLKLVFIGCIFEKSLSSIPVWPLKTSSICII